MDWAVTMIKDVLIVLAIAAVGAAINVLLVSGFVSAWRRLEAFQEECLVPTPISESTVNEQIRSRPITILMEGNERYFEQSVESMSEIPLVFTSVYSVPLRSFRERVRLWWGILGILRAMKDTRNLSDNQWQFESGVLANRNTDGIVVPLTAMLSQNHATTIAYIDTV
jgi:hypothetical protein